MGILGRATGEYPTIHLTADSGPVLRGEREITLYRAKGADLVDAGDRSRKRLDGTGAAASPLSVEEKALFESLRQLRRAIADELGVPPFLVFGDAALEDMCRIRPSSRETFATVRGVGAAKLDQFGDRFIAHIGEHCRLHGLDRDRASARVARPFLGDSTAPTPRPLTDSRFAAAALFKQGVPLEQAAAKLGRAKSTTTQYLVEYIAREKPASIAPWVADPEYTRIRQTAINMNEDRVKPIFEQLNGELAADQVPDHPYEHIRITLAHMRAMGMTVPYSRG
jgi:ATP-dependent DNA helicase RecQ